MEDSREFIMYAVKHFAGKPTISIPLRLISQVHAIATEHLGVADLFRLRDRFEGQAYLDNLMAKIISLYAVQSHLGINSLDLEFISKNKAADILSIDILEEKYRIIPFIFGGLPILDTGTKEKIILVAIRADNKSAVICGWVNLWEFGENQKDNLFLKTTNLAKSKHSKFIGFNHLSSFKSALDSEEE